MSSRTIAATGACTAAAAAVLALVPGGATAAPSQGQSELAAVRQATGQYRDVERAVADGYEASGPCVPGMGYHYVNNALFGAPLDPVKPAALLYAPKPNGELKLIGVEYFVVDADQDVATHNAVRPELFGKRFDGPMPGHGPGMPVHYDLHAYIWQGNPAGVLATENANIDC